MTRFLGTFAGKFDAKGRLAIPAAFRSEFERADSDEVVFRLSHQRPCIEAWTLAGFDRLCEAIDALPHFSEQRATLEDAILAGSARLRIDGEGRVVPPRDMLDELGLKPGDEIAYVGKRDRFEIWSAATARAVQNAARSHAKETGLTLPVIPRDTTPRGMS